MDSKLVVEQMAGRWKIKHPDMRAAGARGAAIVPAPPQVTLTWIPREQNAHADRLANEAMDAAGAARSESARRRQAGHAPRVAARGGRRGGGRAGAGAPTGWSAGPPTSAPRRPCSCCGTGRPRSRPRSASAAGGDDPPLTERRRAQAQAGSRPLAGCRGGVDAVVSSPLRRARQTADVVAAALGLDVREVDDAARERLRRVGRASPSPRCRSAGRDLLAVARRPGRRAAGRRVASTQVRAAGAASRATSCWRGTPGRPSSSSPT